MGQIHTVDLPLQAWRGGSHSHMGETEFILCRLHFVYTSDIAWAKLLGNISTCYKYICGCTRGCLTCTQRHHDNKSCKKVEPDLVVYFFDKILGCLLIHQMWLCEPSVHGLKAHLPSQPNPKFRKDPRYLVISPIKFDNQVQIHTFKH